MDNIIIATITSVLSFLGVVITNIASNRKVESNIDKQQAITDTKLEELTREVRLHNNFAQRIPVIENDINTIKNRIDNLERK